jgi:tetratricopeptide (TPR) repeat protein
MPSGDTSGDALRSGETSAGADETAVVGAPPVPSRKSVPIGSTVGRYVVLEEAGHGGMGNVLRAYDPRLQREVALKEVRSAALGQSASERLIAEARAMARLSHPNVVSVFDVEQLEHERIVLVMEYVAGATLAAWLEEAQRPWRSIVDTFLLAGRGLAAAHGADLLHRDFKPSNVLVGDAVVKVTDFGLATPASESLSEPGDEGSDETDPAELLMGTPRYMAPEQHRGETLRPATDQYAFCVALWEALCGQPPFVGRRLAAKKADGPPSWPNPSIPRSIAAAVRRGLSPAPDDRWPSMSALLDALSGNRSSRHRRAFVALGALGAFGAVGAAVEARLTARDELCAGAEAQLQGIWDGQRREQVRAAMAGTGASYVELVWTRTQTQLDEYASQWTWMYTEACEATTVRGEQSPEVMDLRMACLHRAKVSLTAAIEVLASADREVVGKVEDMLHGLRSLDHCEDVAALQADVEAPSADDAAAVAEARTLLAEAKALREATRLDAAQAKLDAAISVVADVDYRAVHTEATLETGLLHFSRGRYEDADASLRRALSDGLDAGQLDLAWQAARMLMIVVGSELARMDEGLRYREIAEGLAGGDPEREAHVYAALSDVLRERGDFAESLTAARKALELRERVLDPDDPSVANARNRLANALLHTGDVEEAEAQNEIALEALRRVLGAAHPDTISTHNQRGAVLMVRRRYADSEQLLRELMPLVAEAYGDEHPRMASTRTNLGWMLYSGGKHAEAEVEFRAALEIHEKTLEPDHPEVAKTMNNLAHAVHAQNRHDEAEVLCRRALEIRERSLGDDHLFVADSRLELANMLADQKELDEALALAEQAWARFQRDDAGDEQRASAAFLLATILRNAAAPEPDRARALAERALALYEQQGNDTAVAQVRAFLRRE